MKKAVFIFIAASALAFSSCQEKKTGDKNSTELIDNPATASNPDAEKEAAKIEFTFMEYDFQTIVDGEKVSPTFRFKNTGNTDLILSNVQATCGCTVPDTWPKHPIKPGEEGEIKVTFDSKGKSGGGQVVSKDIMVYANTQPPVTTLKIKGFVKPGK